MSLNWEIEGDAGHVPFYTAVPKPSFVDIDAYDTHGWLTLPSKLTTHYPFSPKPRKRLKQMGGTLWWVPIVLISAIVINLATVIYHRSWWSMLNLFAAFVCFLPMWIRSRWRRRAK